MSLENEYLKLIEELKEEISREKELNRKNQEIIKLRELQTQKINTKLQEQITSIVQKNLEVDFLFQVTNFEIAENDLRGLFSKFLELSSMLVWCDVCVSFKFDKSKKQILPITNFILNSDSKLRDANEQIFKTGDFSFLLDEDFEGNAQKKQIDFSKYGQMKELSSLKSTYYFQFNLNNVENVLIIFCFNEDTVLSQRMLELLGRGIDQLKYTLQKYKDKRQILENYKRLKIMKSQLIQSEKMASLGTISAGVAHEINNPLSYLLTNTEVLKEYVAKLFKYIQLGQSIDEVEFNKLKKDIDFILEDTPMLLSESLEGINRIREIVNGLKAFSRADQGDFKAVSINDCIESSLKLVSNELKHKCKITKELEKNLLINGSQGQLIQVITNLLVNSAQAIENFGEIKLFSVKKEDKIQISIEDNGCGISQENIKNLFTPFFTTKPTGKGTGLGLSISYGIIKKHQGNIVVSSEENVGTKFTIELPLLKVS